MKSNKSTLSRDKKGNNKDVDKSDFDDALKKLLDSPPQHNKDKIKKGARKESQTK